jgi:hypothetical protein
MSGAYPHFKTSYTHEELVEHFLLTPADLQLVLGDENETCKIPDRPPLTHSECR